MRHNLEMLEKVISHSLVATKALINSWAENKHPGDSLQPFVAERILACDKTNDKFYYLTKWVGYSHDENTWEPKSSFDGSLPRDFDEAAKHQVEMQVTTPGKRLRNSCGERILVFVKTSGRVLQSLTWLQDKDKVIHARPVPAKNLQRRDTPGEQALSSTKQRRKK